MYTRPVTSAALCALLLVAAACGSDVESPKQGSSARLLEEPPQPLMADRTENEEVPAGSRLKPLVQMATQDLATMLNAKPETIDVIEARFVTWPDSSLGCPQPDLAYMQVLTEGVLIVLRHGSALYHYHGSRAGRPFYCKQPRKPVTDRSGEAHR
jgi:hypothetical protein